MSSPLPSSPSRGARYARQAASLVSAAALGALLFSVHVATSVFRDMPNDRALAGRIAGRAFTGAYWIAVVAAVLAVAVVLTTRSRRSAGDAWLAAGSLLSMGLLQLAWMAPRRRSRGTASAGRARRSRACTRWAGVLHVALALFALLLAWRLLDAVDEAPLPDAGRWPGPADQRFWNAFLVERWPLLRTRAVRGGLSAALNLRVETRLSGLRTRVLLFLAAGAEPEQRFVRRDRLLAIGREQLADRLDRRRHRVRRRCARASRAAPRGRRRRRAP